MRRRNCWPRSRATRPRRSPSCSTGRPRRAAGRSPVWQGSQADEWPGRRLPSARGKRRPGGSAGTAPWSADGAGMAADTSRRFGVWTGAHCSESRLEAGAGVCRGDPSRHDADIRAGSLFDVDTFGDDEATPCRGGTRAESGLSAGLGPVSAEGGGHGPGPRARHAGARGRCALGAGFGLVCTLARRSRAGGRSGGLGLGAGAGRCGRRRPGQPPRAARGALPRGGSRTRPGRSGSSR